MVAGDPRRGQRGDVQRSRQKLVTDLRRRQRIRPEKLGLFAHFRADLIDANDGDTVDTWNDQSGNERHISTDSVRSPTYVEDGIDGQPALDLYNRITMAASFDRVGPFDRCIVMAVVSIQDTAGELFRVVQFDANDSQGDLIESTNEVSEDFVDVSSNDPDFTTSSSYRADQALTPELRLVEARRTADELRLLVDGDTWASGSNEVPALEPDYIALGRIAGGESLDTLFGEVMFLVGDQVSGADTWRSDLKDRWGL